MNPIVLKISFLMFYAAMIVIRWPHFKTHKKLVKTRQEIDRTEKITLAFANVGCMLIPLIYVLIPGPVWGDYALPIGWQAVGLLLLVLSLYFFYRSHHDLGRNWSVSLEIQQEHKLVTAGLYQHIRHPMYTAIWLWSIAFPLVLNNWIAGFSSLVAFGTLYFLRIDREEKLMLDQFGQAYTQYMKRTKRLIPLLY